MRNAFGGYQHHARFHLQLSVLEHEHAASLEHVIDLVQPLVGVTAMRLAGFESVQPAARPPRTDAEDGGAAIQGIADALIAATLLVGVAGTVGLAWTVFKGAGGM